MSDMVKVNEDTAEACLRQALMYLYEEERQKNKATALPLAYNRAIGITNHIYSALGDKHIVKNDIDKIKQMQDIIAKLTQSNQSDVRYMAKSLAGLLSELIK